jgi:hypothetical protein
LWEPVFSCSVPFHSGQSGTTNKGVIEKNSLKHPVDDVSTKNEQAYQEHGTSIRELIGQDGMRVIGRAYDLGIIKEAADGGTDRKDSEPSS